jgi:predicted metalloendopeptidase
MDLVCLHSRNESNELIFFISGSLYVKAVFGEQDRRQANELITYIRQMFDENLNKLEWIDEQSKIEAQKKLKKITEKVGYPNFINNKTKLNERFVHDLNQSINIVLILVIRVIQWLKMNISIMELKY